MKTLAALSLFVFWALPRRPKAPETCSSPHNPRPNPGGSSQGTEEGGKRRAQGRRRRVDADVFY